MAIERKPLSAIVLAQTKPKAAPEGENESSSEGGAEAAAFSELLTALGIEPKDEDAARSAFTDLVRACVAKSKAGKYDKGE